MEGVGKKQCGCCRERRGSSHRARKTTQHASIALAYTPVPLIHHEPQQRPYSFPLSVVGLSQNKISGITCKLRSNDHLLSCHHNLNIITRPHPPTTSMHPCPYLIEAMKDLLPPERAAFCEPSFPTRGLAQHGRAAAADDDGLGVREDGCDGEAAGALDVHEEGAGDGYECLGFCGVSG